MSCEACESTLLWEDTLNGVVVCTSCGSCARSVIVFGNQVTNPAPSPEETTQPKTSEVIIPANVYDRWTKELSRHVVLDRRAIARLSRETERIVRQDIRMKYVLPTALVLAVYFGLHQLTHTRVEKVSLCDAMCVKLASVDKISKKINLKGK